MQWHHPPPSTRTHTVKSPKVQTTTRPYRTMCHMGMSTYRHGRSHRRPNLLTNIDILGRLIIGQVFSTLRPGQRTGRVLRNPEPMGVL